MNSPQAPGVLLRSRLTGIAQRPFWGRQSLLQAATAGLSNAGNNVLLVGAGGAGKTSLAFQVTRVLAEQKQGPRVIQLAATEATKDSPLAVFDPILREAPLQDTDSRSVEALAQSLIRACVEQSGAGRASRLILHIDDVPFLDSMSERVLDYLISRVDVRVIMTCRTNPGPSALIVRAWREGIITRVEVPELSPEETGEFAQAMMQGREFAPATVHRLHTVTGGNPLFLRELLGVLDSSEALHNRQGIWVWTKPLPAGTSLADLVRIEVEQLPPTVREAFERIAICAPISVQLMGTDGQHPSVGELIALGLVHVVDAHGTPAPLLTLVHPLFGEIITEQLRAAQKAAHFRDAYDSAVKRFTVYPETPGVGDPLWVGGISELVTVVDWGLKSGSPIPLPLLETAFRFAQQLGDYVFRVRIASAVLASPEASIALRTEALVNRVEAHRYLNDPGRAANDGEQAKVLLNHLPPSPARNKLIADLATLLSESFVLQRGAWQEAMAVLDWADALLPEPKTASRADRTQSLRVAASRGVALAYGGQMHASMQLQDNLAALTKGSNEFLPLASTSIILLGQRGQAKRARSLARTQIAHAVQSLKEYPLAPGEIMAAWCLADMFTGNTREASLIYSLMNTAAAKNPGNVQMRKTLVAFGQGLLASMNGEWANAVRHLSLACSELEDFTGTGSEGLLLASLTQAYAANGQPQEAAQARAQYAGWSTGTSGLLELPSRYFLLLAALHAPTGAERQEATALIDLARTFDFPLMELRAWHALSLCEGNLSHEELAHIRELARGIDAPIAAVLVESCEHQATGASPYLDESVRKLARHGLFIPHAAHSELTPREQQIAELLALGYSNGQIAKKLTVSKRTIETHAARVFQKLYVSSREGIPEALAALEGTGP